MNRSKFYIATALMILLSFVTIALAQTGSELTSPNMPGKMKAAIEKSLQDEATAAKTKEAIKPGETPGFLGIPGAPNPSLFLGFLWAIFFGWAGYFPQ